MSKGKSKSGSQFIPRQKKTTKPRKAKPAPTQAQTSERELKSIQNLVMQTIRKHGETVALKKVYPELLTFLDQEQCILILNNLQDKKKIAITESGKVQVLANLDVEKKTLENEIIIGKVDLTKTGAAYILVDGWEKDIYVPAQFIHGALNGDTVRVELLKARKNKIEGKIVEIIRRGQESFTGVITMMENFAFFKPDNKNLRTDFFIPKEKIAEAKDGDRVIARVTNWDDKGRNPVAEVAEVLTGKSEQDTDMKSILIENGFHTEFLQASIEELNKIPDAIPAEEIAKRLDFRKVLTFTIDPEDAKDFDDALSYRMLPNGKHEIGVHIADVSHYLKEGSSLDKEAAQRATSVYLPDRVCPMLPERLSNFLCSLRPNEDKLTFSAIFELDEKLNITHQTIAKTVIHSQRRFTYEEAQTVIETGVGDCAEVLLLLNKISKKIRAARFENGAISFEKSEVRFKIDSGGMPEGLQIKVRKDAHLLIEDFMLLANEAVAKFGSKLKQSKRPYPFVYRVHDQPNETKLAQFSLMARRFGYSIKFESGPQIAAALNTLLKKVEGKPEQNVLETMAIRCMAKAEYTLKNIGHYGLAMQFYTHFTSPIRRYPDVMVHRITYEELSGQSHRLSTEELEVNCKAASQQERKANECEREANKYFQVLFLTEEIGEEFDAIITGVTARGIFAEMVANKCEGMIPLEELGNEDFLFLEENVQLKGRRTGKTYQMGDPIRVKLLSTDLKARRINLGIL